MVDEKKIESNEKVEVTDKVETNEFESLSSEEESAPEQAFSEVPKSNDGLIDAGTAGTVYDWSKAPEGTKAPPRDDLNGKEVTIKKADIILPPFDKKWELTKFW